MGGCTVRRSFDRATLTPLREMPSEDALALLAIYKTDPIYSRSKIREAAVGTCVRQAASLRSSRRDLINGTTPAPRRVAEAPSIWRCTFSMCRSSMPSSISLNAGTLMVEIIRKGELPRPEEVPAGLRAAAAAALKTTLREPRPPGFRCYSVRT